MDPITGALISAGGSLGSSALSYVSAERQMDFQAKMRRTAHQDEVRDLRLAGLNPILSAMGNGASVPGGAGFEVGNIGESFSNTAMAASRNKAEVESILTGIDKTRSDIKVNDSLMGKMTADTRAANSAAFLNEAQAARARNLSDLEKTAFGKVMAYGDRLMQVFGLGSDKVK